MLAPERFSNQVLNVSAWKTDDGTPIITWHCDDIGKAGNAMFVFNEVQ